MVLWLYASYTAFLVCSIFNPLIIWGLTELIVRKLHGNIVRDKGILDIVAKQEIVRNVKAMFMHKVGTALVMTVDGLIISGFIGVAM